MDSKFRFWLKTIEEKNSWAKNSEEQAKLEERSLNLLSTNFKPQENGAVEAEQHFSEREIKSRYWDLTINELIAAHRLNLITRNWEVQKLKDFKLNDILVNLNPFHSHVKELFERFILDSIFSRYENKEGNPVLLGIESCALERFTNGDWNLILEGWFERALENVWELIFELINWPYTEPINSERLKRMKAEYGIKFSGANFPNFSLNLDSTEALREYNFLRISPLLTEYFCRFETIEQEEAKRNMLIDFIDYMKSLNPDMKLIFSGVNQIDKFNFLYQQTWVDYYSGDFIDTPKNLKF